MSAGSAVFSPADYAALLDAFLTRNYRVVDFASAEADQRHLILRHDVDMCLNRALALAELEAERGAQAHYFVLIRSALYNALAPEGVAALQRMTALGHRVGLHFDAALYRDDLDALDAAAAQECRWLEEAAGHAVEMISFHRPAKALLGLARLIAGRPHAYQPRVFQDIGYCSDSAGRWGHGHPLDHPAVAEGRALQLLTHPIWWIGPAGDTAQTRLDRLVREVNAGWRDELSRHCRAYRPTVIEP